MSNSSCPDSKTWAQFILNDNMPDREELLAHLAECRTCRFLFDQYRKDHAELSRAWSNLAYTRIIHLYPLSVESQTHYRNGSLLAAQGQREDEKMTSITLSSESNEVFLKAIRDAHSEDTWLYLLAEDKEAYKGALIRPFGIDKEFVLNAGGRVNIGQVSWPLPKPDSAEIRLPDSVFSLAPFDMDIDHDKYIEFESAQGDTIKLSLDKEDQVIHFSMEISPAPDREKKSSFKVALKPAGNIDLCHIKPVADNKVAFETTSGAAKIDIYLYQTEGD